MDAPFRMEAILQKIAIALLLLGLSVGCQTVDPSIELLESELRAQEDQLYTLDRQVEQLCAQLASCRRNNTSLRQQLASKPAAVGDKPASASGSPTDGTRSPSGPPTIDNGPSQPPLVPVPDPANLEQDDLDIPQIDLGPDAPPPTTTPPGADELQPPAETSEDDYTGTQAVNVQVSRIVLNSRLTGGLDADGQPGDEALAVVVEPQNSAGQYLPLPGDLTVIVLDPQAHAADRELARWDFDASETVPLMKKSLLGQGVHLQLPWPNQPPTSERLQLQVRYRTPTGNQLHASREVRVDLIATRRENSLLYPAPHSPFPVVIEPFLPPPSVAARDLLPSQSTIPPRAPHVAGWSEHRPQLLSPELPAASAVSRSVVRENHSHANRWSRPQWKPFR